MPFGDDLINITRPEEIPGLMDLPSPPTRLEVNSLGAAQSNTESLQKMIDFLQHRKR
ncbi:MAG: hypothetical protein U0326_31175 [Polyangiales bacterium]